MGDDVHFSAVLSSQTFREEVQRVKGIVVGREDVLTVNLRVEGPQARPLVEQLQGTTAKSFLVTLICAPTATEDEVPEQGPPPGQLDLPGGDIE